MHVSDKYITVVVAGQVISVPRKEAIHNANGSVTVPARSE